MDGGTVLVLVAVAAVGVYLFSRRDRSYPVEERLPIIERAIASGRDVEMEYFANSSKKFSKRTVTPLEISYQYQRPYLRAYDHWRRDERTFRVSRIKSLRDVPRSEDKSMVDSHFPASEKTIMVVDDYPEIVDILRNMLESKGFNVRCAYSGPQLLAGLGEHKPDLIILDNMMPEMDGLEVLTRLKGDPDTVAIPVILLTANVQQEFIIEGYRMGADYVITKPFTNTEVLKRINLLLGGDQGRSVESL